MKNLAKKLTILHKFRNENDVRLKGLETRSKELKKLQMLNHQKIMNTTREDVAKNLKQYLLSNDVFHQTEQLIDKVNEIKEENLMIINLFIQYSKKLSGKTMIIELDEFISHKQKIETLKLISQDMEDEENYKYCTLLNNKVNRLEANRVSPEVN